MGPIPEKVFVPGAIPPRLTFAQQQRHAYAQRNLVGIGIRLRPRIQCRRQGGGAFHRDEGDLFFHRNDFDFFPFAQIERDPRKGGVKSDPHRA